MRASGGPPSASSGSWRPGAVVGGFVLEEVLGRGGMGEVWSARADTGARRAVKRVLEGVDPEAALRFQRELEALVRTDGHPHLARVHAAGTHAGSPWVALELVLGSDLQGLLTREGPLAPAAAARLVAQVARGVAHAHAHGVLHRDIKPANVLLDEAGAPKLVDFGLARLRGADSLTQTGAVLGTPAYAAPEQALGAPADERTDVYGLGGLLHAALTGRPPVEGASAYDVLERVSRGRATAPRDLRPEVPASLDAVARRALAHDPQERWPTASAFADALEGWADGATPTRSRGVRALLGVLGSAFVIVVVVVVVAPAISPAPRGHEAPSPAAGTPGGGAAPVSTRRAPGDGAAPVSTSHASQVAAASSWLTALRRPGPPVERMADHLSGGPRGAVQSLSRLLRGRVLSADEWSGLEALAERRVAAAECALALRWRAGSPARALELAWRATRPPDPELRALPLLVTLLLERGDTLAAEWASAEAAARLGSQREAPGFTTLWSLAAATARIDAGPPPLDRALRLLRQHGAVAFGVDPRAKCSDPMAALLDELVRLEGTGLPPGAAPPSEDALRSALAPGGDASLMRVARDWLERRAPRTVRERFQRGGASGSVGDVLGEADLAHPVETPWDRWASCLESGAQDTHARDLDLRDDPVPPDDGASPAERLRTLHRLVDGRLPEAEEQAASILTGSGGDLVLAARLYWRASRPPRRAPWAGVHLAGLLLRDAPALSVSKARGEEIARWLLAEAAAEAARLEVPPLLRLTLALHSARLDRPSDLARGLRALPDLAAVDLRPHAAEALALGWLRDHGADPAAVAQRLAEVDLEPAARSLLERAAAAGPGLMDLRGPEDDHFAPKEPR